MNKENPVKWFKEGRYSTSQTCRIIQDDGEELKRDKFMQWNRLGFIPVTNLKQHGETKWREFTNLDLCSLYLFKRLIELGMPRKAAALFADHLYSDWPSFVESEDHFLFIYDNGPMPQRLEDKYTRAYLKEGGIAEKISETGPGYVIDLHKIINDVKDKVRVSE